ncbi:MAG: hypothetical protein B6I17_04390 [Tenericutes bacterium 4572_104]|nr:MAG: hypothetical protein B6I17_04390 [Tenericutes bacterium 4572_104]
MVINPAHIEDEKIRERYRIVQFARKSGVSATAKMFNTSRQRIYRLLKKFEMSGLEGLANATKKNYQYGNKMSVEIEQKIIDLKKKDPSLSPREIKEILKIPYSINTIHKKIKQNEVDKSSLKNLSLDLNEISQEIKPLSHFFLSIGKVDNFLEHDFAVHGKIPQYIIVAMDYKTGVVFSSFASSNIELYIAVFIKYLYHFLNKTHRRQRQLTFIPLRKKMLASFKEKDSLLSRLKGTIHFNIVETNDRNRERMRKKAKQGVAAILSHINFIAADFPDFLSGYYFLSMAENKKRILTLRSLHSSLQFPPLLIDSMLSFFDTSQNNGKIEYLKIAEHFIEEVIRLLYDVLLSEDLRWGNKIKICLADTILFLLKDKQQHRDKLIGTLLQRGKALEYMGDYEGALKSLHQAEECDNRCEGKKYSGEILVRYGNIFRDLGNYDRSRKYYQEALFRYHKKKCMSCKVDVLLLMADMDLKFSFFKKSIVKFQTCKRLIALGELSKRDLRIYIGLSVAYLSQGNQLQSSKYFEQAEALASKKGDNQAFIKAFASYGNMIYYAEEDTFLKYLDDFVAYGEQSRDPRVKIAVFEKLGLYNLFKERFTAAEEFFKKGLILAQEGDNFYTAAELYSHLGKCNAYLERVNDARNYVNQSLKLFEKLKLKKKILEQHIILGSLYFINDDISKAFECIHRAMDLSEKYGDLKTKSHCYVNLGAIYYRMEEYEKGIYYCRKQIAITQKSNNIKGLCVAYNNIAESYLKQGRIKGALQNSTKAVRYAEMIKSSYYLCRLLNTLAEVYMKQNRGVLAEKTARKALKFAQEIDDKTAAFLIQNTLKEILEHL